MCIVCGNMLLMEVLKSWLLIGRANLVSTNGQVGSLFNARAVKIKQRVVLDNDRKQMNPPPYFGNPPQIPETVGGPEKRPSQGPKNDRNDPAKKS